MFSQSQSFFQPAHRPHSTVKVRSGFTLVELLVVIAIIGILIAILVPAVQSVREAARRHECSNNQQKIAQALTVYHSSKEHFPRLAVGSFDPATGYVNEPVWSWTVFTLPYLEGQNRFESLNPNSVSAATALSDPTLLATLQTQMKIFRCGSDRGPELNTSRTFSVGGSNVPVALSNYVGANSAGALDLTQYSTSPPLMSTQGCTFGTSSATLEVQGRGLFGSMRHFNNVDGLIDGQSNTIAIGERTWEYGPRSNLQASSAATLYVARPFVGHGYAPGQGAGDSGGTAGRGINFQHSSMVDCMDSFSSSHPAGANFAFVDGSTHFISRDVDLQTLERLVSGNDQLVIGEF